jgi:hypothetical protein
MRYMLAGFKISASFGIVSIVLMVVASLIGLKSPWWPVFWPAFLYIKAGYPILFFIDWFPNVAGAIAPSGGGAPAVFLMMSGCAFIIWGLFFSLLVWRRIVPFNRMSKGN